MLPPLASLPADTQVNAAGKEKQNIQKSRVRTNVFRSKPLISRPKPSPRAGTGAQHRSGNSAARHRAGCPLLRGNGREPLLCLARSPHPELPSPGDTSDRRPVKTAASPPTSAPHDGRPGAEPRDWAREDPGRRPAAAGMPVAPRGDRREGAGRGGRLRPVPRAPPRGPAHLAPGANTSSPRQSGRGSAEPVAAPPSPWRPLALHCPSASPRRARAPALPPAPPPQLRRPLPSAAPFTHRRSLARSLPLPLLPPPQAQVRRVTAALSRAPTVAPGRGGGAPPRSRHRRTPEPAGLYFNRPLVAPTAANRPGGDGRAAPAPRGKSWLRGSGRYSHSPVPPGGSTAATAQADLLARRERQRGGRGQRRAGTARPRRCLAAAAANGKAKRGHASQ